MKKIHYNIPQLEYSLVRPQLGLALMGRGTGKTEGLGAESCLRNVLDMPGSLGGIVCISYDKILSMILPAMKIGWERMGYKENIHYWIRKKPPEKLKIKKAYREPDTPHHLIKWFNGSAILLISIDRIHIANGSSLAWLYADEAKFFPREKFREVLLALRGQAHLFGNKACCESILITTDQPRPEMPGVWVYDIEAQSDSETAMAILAGEKDLIRLREKLAKATDPIRIKRMGKQIESIKALLDDSRRGLNYTIRGSTLDNVHSLGIQVIKNLHATLTPYEFTLSVLNKKMKKSENSFYHLLSDSKHGYYFPNSDYIDRLPNTAIDKDCRWDGDVDFSLPLEISCDYNSAINWVTVGQLHPGEYRILSSFYVLKPDKIKELVNNFSRYYEAKRKVNPGIIFYYDHTAIGENAKDDISFAKEWINALYFHGWMVMDEYIGQTPTHRSRYFLWEKVLAGSPDMPKFRINLTNNIDLMISMYATQTRKDKRGDYQKDKSSEIKQNFPPQHATHAGEALDTLIWIKYRNMMAGDNSYLISGVV